jgi:hypothetical protein
MNGGEKLDDRERPAVVIEGAGANTGSVEYTPGALYVL